MFKEFFRKIMVGLKRKPQTIGLIALVITFLQYSLNLTAISNTTARIQGPGMGLCGFATMLFGILSYLCYTNAFPYRKPVNKPMLILLFVMMGICVFCDVTYINAVTTAVTRAENPIRVTENTLYIKTAADVLNVNIILEGVTAALIVTMPFYSKLIRKVKTSVDVEDNGDMAAIDVAED